MQKITRIGLAMVLFTLFVVQPLFAGCWIVQTSNSSFVKKEIPYDDFYIYFKIPTNANYDLIGLTSNARKTLTRVTINRKQYKNYDLIEVIAGGRARGLGLYYAGNDKGLKNFLNELRFRYWYNWCYTG